MQTFWWTLSVFLILAGLAGTVVPMLPDTILIFAGALVHRVTLGPSHSVGWSTIIVLGCFTAVAHGLDFLSGSLGAKYFGATRWGAIGGILGAIVGIFFGFVGILVGPLLGVLLGELAGGRGLAPATRSTWGTLLGTTAGMVFKAFIAVAMVGWFVIALLV